MKTKGNFRFSAAHSNLTTLQTNTNAAQAVRSITLAQQLKRSSAAPTNHNNIFWLRDAVEDKVILPQFVETQNMAADIFTKALDRFKVQRCARMLGLE